MRYRIRTDMSDPTPVSLAIDAEIRATWRRASIGGLDIAEANRRALELVHQRDRLADLALREEATPCPRP